MFEFLSEAAPLLKAFWYMALISSAIFIVQTIMTFVGGADMDGIDADFDGNFDGVDAPFQMFSLRNLINFMLGFGWTGVVFYDKIENQTLLVGLAVLVGITFVLLFFVMIKQIMKLTEDNTMKVQNFLGKMGEVYIPIPAGLTGKGKVQISVNGAHHEMDAMSNNNEALATGTMVKVVAIEDNILIVTKLN